MAKKSVVFFRMCPSMLRLCKNRLICTVKGLCLPEKLLRASSHRSSFAIHRCEQGFSIFEMIVVFLMVSILLTTAVSNLKELNRPLQNGTAQTVAFFKRVKARAISSTTAYTVAPASSTQLVTSYAKNCSVTTRTSDSQLSLTLPAGVQFASTNWSICFTSRGLTEENLDISLQDNDKTKTLRVYLGGAVRAES